MTPFTRSVSVEIVEIVPERDQLPVCSAWLGGDSADRCIYKARYLQNGNPVCGVHVGRPGLLWHPSTRRKL